MKSAVLALPLLLDPAAAPASQAGEPAPVGPEPAPPDAAAPTPEVITQTADEVARLLGEGKHEEAMALLEAVDPRAEHPPLVYMRGVVEEDRGDCPAAIEHYEHYIDMGVLEVDAKAARRRRDRCERLLEAARATVPPPVEQPPAPAPPERDAPPPRYADPWAISLTALGVVGVGLGAGLFGQGRVDEDAARDAFDLETYRERGVRAVSLQRTGVTIMVVGGGILAAGIARFVWISVARKRAAERSTAWSPLRFRF